MDLESSQTFAQFSLVHNMVRWVLERAGNPRIWIQLWNGDRITTTEARPVAGMELRTPAALFELLRSPAIPFGECYSKDLIEIHGDFLEFVNEATAALARKNEHRYYGPKIGSLLYAIRANSLGRSRRNVRHHYDLGNDFYKLWLDERMVYTCAYFRQQSDSLAEAQLHKLDHVCRKLQLRPRQKVVEAGCGWGALALHMAEHYGVEVIAYNHSREQLDFARQQAGARGLNRRVTFVEDDYRNIHERCDAFVSIGMLEHVGLANFATLGAIIKRSLKPSGIGLIHSIGRTHPQKMDAWIVKHIFPGGYVPSLGEMSKLFEPCKFSVLDVENLRPHYARTCALWLSNFEAVADDVARMYDEEFVRMWRLYLAGSSAGFQSGTLQLYQILFAPYDNNSLPWTRDHLYCDEIRRNSHANR